MYSLFRFITLGLFLSLSFYPVLAQTIYSQNFSSGLGGWTVSNTTAISVTTTSASSGYTTPIAASGGNNLGFGECGGNTEHVATSPAINTVGRTNLMVGFGRRRTNAFGPQVVIFEFSTDGGTTWTLISSDVSSVATTTWALSVFNLPTAAENKASVLFRFRYTPPAGAACNTAFRIDDFTVTENGALPVEFLYVRGTAQSNGNQLTWETGWELGASHFVVERSADAQEFDVIGQMAAVGNTTEKQLYSFLDGEPLAGIGYYRIRQVDNDGSSRNSKLISVARSEWQEAVCENPSSGHAIFLKASIIDPGSIQLLTTLGQPVPFQLTQQTATHWLIRPLVPLPAGLYLISIGQNNVRRTLRVIVL